MISRKTAGVLIVLAALAGCSSGEAPTPSPTPSASLPPAASIPPPAKPAPSRSTESAGKAPSRTFEVTTRRLSLNRGGDRPLPTTVWAPRGQGRFPLIVFSHGLTGLPADYAELTRAWARAGFVVAAPAYPFTSRGAELNPLDVLNQPEDARFVITQVLAEMRGRVDPERIAAAGHSAGGITTLAQFSSARDARLDAGLVLAGRQVLPAPFTGTAAPLMFVHGRQDPTVAYVDGRTAFDAVPWPKALLTITRGGHLPTGDELDLVAVTSTDFWRWSLYGDRAARARLDADATEGGLATLTDRLG